jgi:AcrR family transcriptional regulator
MSAKSWRATNHDKLRGTILDAARPLFVEEGYEKFSMRKLSQKIRCSHGNLYTYFRSKQQLFDYLMQESFAQLAQALQRVQQTVPPDDPVRLLKEAGAVYVDFGLKNPHAYEFAFIIRRTGPVALWNPHAAFAFLRSIVKRCIEEKFFRAADVDTTAQAMWAAVHGVTSLLILRPTFPWTAKKRLIHQVVDSAVDSMRAERRKPKKRTRAPSRLQLHPGGARR